MASLPSIRSEGDSLAHSLAVQRSKALGGRMTRTRLSPPALRRLVESPERIGPKTVLRPPIALLGRVLSEKDFRTVNVRFPLSSYRVRRVDAQTVESAAATNLAEPPEEEKHTEQEVASKMKEIQQTVQLFSVKILGEGHRPEAREGSTMVTINRKMYLFGGRCRQLFNDVKAFDPETEKWETQRPLPTVEGPPEPRMNHSAVRFKNWMVVYGGCDRFNEVLQFRNCFSLVHCYDTLTRTWSSAKPAGLSPEPRRNHCTAVVGRNMYIYGGTDRLGKTLDDLHGVNLEMMAWFAPSVARRPKPGPVSNATLTAVFSAGMLTLHNFDFFALPKMFDDVFVPKVSGLYLIGGLSDKGETSSDVYLLKPKKTSKDDRQLLSWTKLDLGGVHPEPRHSHSVSLCGKFLFVFGGRNESRELKSMALLNVESQRWDKIDISGDIPSARWGHCTSTIGSKIVLFGGMKLAKYCSAKTFILELDPSLAKELAAQWSERRRRLEGESTALRLVRSVSPPKGHLAM